MFYLFSNLFILIYLVSAYNYACLRLAHYDVGTSGLVTSVLCGLWPVGLFALAVKYLGAFGLVIIGVIVIALLAYVNKIRANKVAAE